MAETKSMTTEQVVCYLTVTFAARAAQVTGRDGAGDSRGPFCRTFRDGSDGTRTRDLRRDRPVRANRLGPATTRNHRATAGIFSRSKPL